MRSRRSRPSRAMRTSVARGLDYLLGEQQGDGSWWGRWGVNHVYGTGAVLPALEACGFEARAPGVSGRPSRGSTRVQDADGGFGEDIRSYHETSMRGRGVATASQTAWALLGYVAAGDPHGRSATQSGRLSCARSKRRTATGAERHYTGTGFPTDFMIRYHLYRLHFPLMALGRLRERLNAMKFPLRSTVQIGRYVAAQKRKGELLPARAHARAHAGLQPRLHRLREDPRVRVEQGAPLGRRVHRRGRPVPGSGRLDLRRRAADLQGDRGRRRRHARAAEERSSCARTR